MVVWVFRGVVGTVGIVLLIWGICNGGMADVLKKAINICTQCIGLG
ncbi:MAG: thioredoxin [Clostridiales bacterium]|nr:thioredoxin [Clostridiales bacterium]